MEPPKTSLSVSKITPPRLPKILYRSRLLKLIEQNRDKKLLLILGQAAQGKSTLAASYVHDLEIPLYREWINAIFERISVPIQIVLDGLDRLSSEAPSFQFFQVLVEDVPNHIHLMMLSREEPPFEVQALKMRQEVDILTNEDLAFTPDEIKAFFRELRGMSFASGELRKVHQFTEGWIGGLLLLSETLERLPEDLRERYLSEDIPERFKGAVFQYFGEEILSSQPAPIQEFLIKSSIFETIEPGLIKDSLGIENTEEVLHEHVRKNLFVQSNYDDKKGWVFRYHQLFRDFLQAKFRSEIGEKERRSLFLKAGSIHEQRRELEESVKYYLKARAYDRAASVIEQIGMNLVQMGRARDLAQWVQAIPEDLVQENPWLLFFLSMTRRYTATDQNIGSLELALTHFEKQENTRGCILSLAFLIEATMIKGRDTIPVAYLLNKAEKLLKTLDPDIYVQEKAILLIQVGFGFILRGGNPRKGLWACENAYLISKNLGIFLLQVNALVHMVMAHTFLGEFSLADNACEKLDKVITKWSIPELRSIQLVHYCHLCIWRGAFEKAEETIREAKKEIQEYGLTYLYPVTLLYDLALRNCLEDHEAGVMVGNRLLELTKDLDNLFLQGVATLFLGAVYYRKEEFEKAKVLVKDAVRILSSHEARSDEHLNEAKVFISYIADHLQTIESPEKELMEALKYFSDTKNFLFLADANFAMAHLKWKESDVNETIRHLETGFQIAEEKKFDSFIASSKKDLVKTCTLALELQVKEAMDHAAHLLSTRLASEAGPELEKLSHHSNAKIRKKAREIRIAINRSKIPRLRIKTLGGFRVLRGDTPISEKEWQGKKPRAILKAIVASSSKGVLNEIIMEDVWPDAPFDKVGNNYKVGLHRLRKALEPGIDKALGSSYIHIKDDALYLDEDFCEVDIHTFLSLIENGRINEKKGDIKGALKHYDEAAALYKGDFLPEDLYAPWIELRREKLRNAYLALLLRIATLHENKGAMSKAISFYKKAIRISPLLEDAYQRLMVLYSNMGKRNEALKIYERCRKALRDELDVEPDQVTVALYEKIVG